MDGSALMIRTCLTVALLLAVQGHAGQNTGQNSGQSKVEQSAGQKSQVAQNEARHDHVGKPLPDYLTGDQCLFCHELKIGPTWEKDSHAWTTRPVGVPPTVTQLAADATHVLGSAQHFRALKQTGYGKFAVLSADGKTWQPDVFASRCAGCHASGVDPATRTFSSFALDCYACHGDVPIAHNANPTLVWLGSKHVKPSREIVFVCGQCHLRGGRSQSTGLPYPNNFVAGDDLFADFQVDLKRADDPLFNPTDRHVYTKVRNVLEHGSDVTCLNCHQIHGRQPAKRLLQPHSDVCDY